MALDIQTTITHNNSEPDPLNYNDLWKKPIADCYNDTVDRAMANINIRPKDSRMSKANTSPTHNHNKHITHTMVVIQLMR